LECCGSEVDHWKARATRDLVLWRIETANDASLLAIAHAIAAVFWGRRGTPRIAPPVPFRLRTPLGERSDIGGWVGRACLSTTAEVSSRLRAAAAAAAQQRGAADAEKTDARWLRHGHDEDSECQLN
jgi:hypothetical protein